MSEKFEKDGVETEYFTADEVKAQAEAAATAEAARVAAEKDTEIERLKKISNEKTENFRKYNEMTQEERDAHSANELNLIQRGDKLEEKLTETARKLEEKEKSEREYAKNSTLKAFHADLPEVKQKIEESYAALAGMPETTPEEITARATAAARLAGISVDQRNPIYQSIHGAPPVYKDKSDYVDTPEGKTAADLVRQATGLPQPKA